MSDPITKEDFIKYFQDFIGVEKPDLNKFYSSEALLEKAEVADSMAKRLRTMGCGKEVARQLSLLTLYDIAMLLGFPSSVLNFFFFSFFLLRLAKRK